MLQAFYTAKMSIPYIYCKYTPANQNFNDFCLVKKGKALRFLKNAEDGEQRKPHKTRQFKVASLTEFKTAKSSGKLGQVKICEVKIDKFKDKTQT